MKNWVTIPAAAIAAGFCLVLGVVPVAGAQNASPAPRLAATEAVVTMRASGTFEVKLKPLASYDTTAGSKLGRMSIDKQFSGDLAGTSAGEMLTALTDVENSAGYVAMERVSGTLHGKRGAFLLQHSGTMTRGAQQLTITVVPDSGTGELGGLVGKMTITIAGGTHSYELEYTLPAAR